MESTDYTRGYVKIDLDAIRTNVEGLNQLTSETTKMMLVIKADGYGHGAIPIAHECEGYEFVWGFGVATLDEAILLRVNYITKPIHVLGCVFADQFGEAIKHDIQVTIYSLEQAYQLNLAAQELNKTVKVHIKIDTGMGRLGFVVDENILENVKEIFKLDNLQVEGIFTHFSRADESDRTYTDMQANKFLSLIQQCENENLTFPLKHCANSATTIQYPEYHLDMVRAGISIYGLYPSEDVDKNIIKLNPAMRFCSTLSSNKELGENESVSYGGLFTTEKNTRVATVPIGYADGYSRSLSNKGAVLVNGKRANILGKVCMDQFTIDISEIPDAKKGSSVVLIGTDGDELISVEELGDISGRFNYEFVCGISKRIPRVYVRADEVIGQIDYFA